MYVVLGCVADPAHRFYRYLTGGDGTSVCSSPCREGETNDLRLSTRVWRAGESGNRLEIELRGGGGGTRPVALTTFQRWPHSDPEVTLHNGLFQCCMYYNSTSESSVPYVSRYRIKECRHDDNVIHGFRFVRKKIASVGEAYVVEQIETDEVISEKDRG